VLQQRYMIIQEYYKDQSIYYTYNKKQLKNYLFITSERILGIAYFKMVYIKIVFHLRIFKWAVKKLHSFQAAFPIKC